MNLVIVESPTKARTLTRFFGPDFKIQATLGHVRDLPKSQFGVDVEHDFTPQYVVIAGRKKNIAEIKKLSSSAKEIYLATDPDREGEAIAWHIAQLLSDTQKQKNKKTKKQFFSSSVFQSLGLHRIVFHEITESAVKDALAHPHDVDMDLVNAQQARRVLDRIVGYKLSPLLWRKVRRGLSAGRVQSVAVRLIVDREREIEAFRPEEYWEIWCEVAQEKRVTRVEGLPTRAQANTEHWREGEPGAGPAFLIKLIQINGQKADVKNKKRADAIVADLEKAAYRVASVEKKEVSKSPPPPFTTSTMTQAAARLYFWSAKRTMQLAQKLYEEGLITYHRTDSTNLAAEAVRKVRDFIYKEYGKDYLPEKPRFYKITSKVAQEAHEAIRPTDANFKFQISNFKLGKDAGTLYQLIWKRFVACQMANALYDETTINVNATNHYLLQAKGQVLKFPGWRVVYGNMEKEEVPLPDVKEDEPLQLLKIDPQQKFTQPPDRYTEATLIKTLEKLSIGRPSTYAPIISTIQERVYVEKKEGRFYPTPVGVATNDFLVTNFSDIVDYRFTAKMEDDLDEIANGRVKWVPMMQEFWKPFEKKVETVGEKAKRVKIQVEETGEACPKCKVGKQVIRVGRFGKFLSCSRFPDCDWKGQHVEKVGMKCPDCREGDVIIRKTRRGRQFFGCSRYPACKFASWRSPKGDNSEQVTGDSGD